MDSLLTLLRRRTYSFDEDDATTFAEAKIRVNSIAPGIFPGEKTAGESNEQQKPELDMEMSNPAGRFGRDTDMGACILAGLEAYS
jgi:NAD(P)-dependent dehydrogenase (short-subunit alcohol dehydrogenase family)